MTKYKIKAICQRQEVRILHCLLTFDKHIHLGPDQSFRHLTEFLVKGSRCEDVIFLLHLDLRTSDNRILKLNI